MTDKAHTPGPWGARHSEFTREDGSLADFWDICGPDERYLIAIPPVGMMGNEHEANARLIAAAPELLEALEEAEKHFGPFADITINGQHDADDVRVVALMRAAIARAKGGTA